MSSDSNAPVLGLGVVGLGMGATLMVRGILDHPSIRVVAGAARTPEVRERFAQDLEARGYESVEALCADPSVDVVFVATPHELHREHATMAAEHGKHIIVEKPMALTLEDCDAIIDAADAGSHMLRNYGSCKGCGLVTATTSFLHAAFECMTVRTGATICSRRNRGYQSHLRDRMGV